jgi:thymidylate synthase
MYLKARTLDDLLAKTFSAVLKSKTHVNATKGPNIELAGVVLELSQPRTRLSRTDAKGNAFSGLGELIWYLSGSDRVESIEYYIPMYREFAERDGSVRGAYGPRIFGGARTQYDLIRSTLRSKPWSRQAVIQIFDQRDIRRNYKDVPCTCNMQFIIRDGLLNLIVSMRSNDAFMGLSHDIFAFTMIQEILSRDLGLGLGVYKHMVGSLHVYNNDLTKVRKYLNEGVQATKEMPAMPDSDPWPSILKIIQIESDLRVNRRNAVEDALQKASDLDPYWLDLVRLLAIFAITKGMPSRDEAGLRQVADIRRAMSSPFYSTYIRRRIAPPKAGPAQLVLLTESGDVERAAQ